MGPEGYLALGPHLTTPGIPSAPYKPINSQVGNVVRHGRFVTLDVMVICLHYAQLLAT
jgi:hypothetical protein